MHEANAKPGLANVLGARRASGVGVAFGGTPLRSSRVVGMPLRREIVDLDREALRAEAAEWFGLDAHRPTLLVFGGSLGALRLNEAFGEGHGGAWRDIVEAGWQLIHVTGERSELADPGAAGYAMRRYVDRMDLAFAIADLIVSRAGAATVSEISALGIPAVYVPYAVGNGEQALNAASAVEAGAAILIPDADFTADRVRADIVPLLADERTPHRHDGGRRIRRHPERHRERRRDDRRGARAVVHRELRPRCRSRVRHRPPCGTGDRRRVVVTDPRRGVRG